jgi:hypothetical protein
LSASRAAVAAERAAIAQALDIVSCEDMTADYVIRPLGEGRYRMSGRISARLTQRCVVTLEPIPQMIEESFDVEFWPALPQVGDAEVEVLSVPDIEPLEHGLIAAGRICFEILAASLDPYPRKAGARFLWEDGPSASGSSETGPFAGLKKLKDKR